MSTQFGAVIGTLEYMSPEQAGFSGVDIDTRADIYSLGVILYELLTGLRPIDAKRLRNAALTEMIRIIREEEPSKPSTRLSTDDSLPSMAALRQTEPQKLMALLRGELDWVVMKCLEKHRERRYETANALARDIQRYLADEAVEARPPSAGYRLSKFLQRNRGPVLAASLVLLALRRRHHRHDVRDAPGGSSAADEAKQRGIAEANEAKALAAAEAERKAKDREAEQRAKAEKARDRTRQALDAMTSSVTGDSLTTQKEISDEQKKFLTEVLTYYQEFAGEKADDEPSRARTAAAAFRVGDRVPPGPNGGSGGRHRLAIDGYAKLAADSPPCRQYRQGLAGSQDKLGILLADLGKRAEAEEQYRKALAIEEKLVADSPPCRTTADPGRQPQQPREFCWKPGEAAGGGGAVSESPGDPREAGRRVPRRAGVPQEPGRHPQQPGNSAGRPGKRPEAEEQYRKALAIQREAGRRVPRRAGVPPGPGRQPQQPGDSAGRPGEAARGGGAYRKALAIAEKLAATPRRAGVPPELAVSHINVW